MLKRLRRRVIAARTAARAWRSTRRVRRTPGVPEFLQVARQSFLELQAAWDRADLPALEVMTSESLLHELMLSQVQVAGGRRLSLASALESRYQTPVEEALEAVGVIVEGDSVLFNKSLALRYLLTHDWKGKRIDQILSRIPGVSRVVRRSGKTSLRYICIPRSLFGELKSDPEPEQASERTSGQTDPFGQKFEW